MEDDVKLRAATAADVGAISELTRRAYTPWIAVTGRPPLPMQVDYSSAIQAHDFAVVDAGGLVVGLIETVDEGDTVLIVNVAVEPSMHGRGIGQRLLAYAESSARSRGMARAWLYTNRLFVRNLRLYSFLGYRIDREEPLNGGVAVHMSKPLA